MARTYELLSNLPGVPVKICQQILPNHMQCWKPAAVLITSTEEVPATDTAEASTTTTTVQMCKTHAYILQQADAQAASTATEIQAVEQKAADLKAELLQEEAVTQQTSMPKGEDSPNNKK